VGSDLLDEDGSSSGEVVVGFESEDLWEPLALFEE
jgi:hypothetical protein